MEPRLGTQLAGYRIEEVVGPGWDERGQGSLRCACANDYGELPTRALRVRFVLDSVREGAMTQDVLELARRGFEAWRRGDLETIGTMLAPDVKWGWFEPGDW